MMHNIDRAQHSLLQDGVRKWEEGSDPLSLIIIILVSVAVIVAAIITIYCCWDSGPKNDYDTDSNLTTSDSGANIS